MQFFFRFAAIWLAHITVDGEFREIVIFKNEACSKQTGKHCVLSTHQNDEEDYLLIGKVKFFGFFTYSEFKKGCAQFKNRKSKLQNTRHNMRDKNNVRFNSKYTTHDYIIIQNFAPRNVNRKS